MGVLVIMGLLLIGVVVVMGLGIIYTIRNGFNEVIKAQELIRAEIRNTKQKTSFD